MERPDARKLFTVPTGEAVYSNLRTAFMKMDGLLDHLGREHFNGYILLHDASPEGGAEGLLLLRGGAVVAARYGEDWGDEAKERLSERVAFRSGKLDIIGLGEDTVAALAPSLGPQAPYTDLRTSFVNLDALVAYLGAKSFSGSVSVEGAGGRGVALLSGGRFVGAYTDSGPALEASLEAVKALGADGEAAVWVSSALAG